MFRYPGGKSKLKKEICSKLSQVLTPTSLYIEPFFGSGAIGLNLLKHKKIFNILFNDLDYSIFCIWDSIISCPVVLKLEIESIIPSVDLFFYLKDLFLDTNKLKDRLSTCKIAAYKIALHQMSYSGLGPMAGGPIGGKSQTSRYAVNCRWSPKRVCKEIDLYHSMLKGVNIIKGSCLNLTYKSILVDSSCLDSESVLYLDPPYFEKGNDLYLNGFKVEDHLELFSSIQSISNKVKFLVSYDDCSYIRKLYSQYSIEELVVRYSICGSTKKKELLISNF